MSNYEEFLVQGAEEGVRAFVAGWAAGRGIAAEELARRVLFARDWHVRSETRVEGFVEALRRGHAVHLLVRNDTTEALSQAFEIHGGGLAVRARRRVQSAAFEFSYEMYSRHEAEEVRAFFEALPSGVSLSPDYRPVETSDPAAAGVELYAPEHGYVLKAHGSASGELLAVLELRQRSRQHERIRTKDVLLTLSS